MSRDGRAGTLVSLVWLTVDWVSGGDRAALLLDHPLDPLDAVYLVLVQSGGDQYEAVPRAVDVLVVGGEGGAGHLDVGVGRAGDEAKPLHDGLSEEEKSLVPALLGEVLKETFPLVFDALQCLNSTDQPASCLPCFYQCRHGGGGAAGRPPACSMVQQH